MEKVIYGKHKVLTKKIFKKYGFKPISMASPASAWKDIMDIDIDEEDIVVSYIDKNEYLIDVNYPYGLQIGYRCSGNNHKNFSGEIKDEKSFAALISIIRKGKI